MYNLRKNKVKGENIKKVNNYKSESILQVNNMDINTNIGRTTTASHCTPTHNYVGESIKNDRLTDSPFKMINIMDKRFERLSEHIENIMDKKLNEYKNDILNDIHERFDVMKKDLLDVIKRVSDLEAVANNIKNASNEIALLKSQIKNQENISKEIKSTILKEISDIKHENNALKEVAKNLQRQLKKQENFSASFDIRINGIPSCNGENLTDIYRRICETIQVRPPSIERAYRVGSNRNNHIASSQTDSRKNTDTAIIIKFLSPYDRNHMLKYVKDFIKTKRSPLRLSHIGINSNVPFFINENLSSANHKIFLCAHRLKKNKLISAAFTRRGQVFIKPLESDEPICIDEMSSLNQFFRSPSSAVGSDRSLFQ